MLSILEIAPSRRRETNQTIHLGLEAHGKIVGDDITHRLRHMPVVGSQDAGQRQNAAAFPVRCTRIVAALQKLQGDRVCGVEETATPALDLAQVRFPPNFKCGSRPNFKCGSRRTSSAVHPELQAQFTPNFPCVPHRTSSAFHSELPVRFTPNFKRFSTPGPQMVLAGTCPPQLRCPMTKRILIVTGDGGESYGDLVCGPPFSGSRLRDKGRGAVEAPTESGHARLRARLGHL